MDVAAEPTGTYSRRFRKGLATRTGRSIRRTTDQGDARTMQTNETSEASRQGMLTTFGSTIGLALGPSVIANLTVSAYITPIQAEFGWTRVQVSLAFTIVAYMIVLVSPLQGFFVDRFGPRRVVLTSIPLFAASLAALYFTPKNLLVYYVLWSLVPVAALGLWPL